MTANPWWPHPKPKHTRPSFLPGPFSAASKGNQRKSKEKPKPLSHLSGLAKRSLNLLSTTKTVQAQKNLKSRNSWSGPFFFGGGGPVFARPDFCDSVRSLPGGTSSAAAPGRRAGAWPRSSRAPAGPARPAAAPKPQAAARATWRVTGVGGGGELGGSWRGAEGRGRVGVPDFKGKPKPVWGFPRRGFLQKTSPEPKTSGPTAQSACKEQPT